MDCFRRDENLTGLIDLSDRALELFARNFWKTVRDFLIWCVLNFARGNFAPALNPASTGMTFAIPNHERPRWRVGHAHLAIHEMRGGGTARSVAPCHSRCYF